MVSYQAGDAREGPAAVDISLVDYSDLIGRIYDCAINPEGWAAALTELRQKLGFANAALSLMRIVDGAFLLNAHTGIPPAYADAMFDYGPDVLELWGGAAVVQALPLDEPLVLSRVNPASLSEGTANRYTREWAWPQGLSDAMGLTLARDDEAFATIGMGRHRDAEPIGDKEITAAKLLLPHLQRSVAINRMLDVKTITASTFEAALDTLATPVILVDRSLSVVHANRKGRQMLDEPGPLQIRNNILNASPDGAMRALRISLAQVERDESALARKGFGIPIRHADGVAGALYVLPLQHGTLRSRIAPRALVALFVSRIGAPTTPAADVIAALFDLTPAEASVLREIARGSSPTEAAERLSIGLSTVRTHLTRIFDKTGTHRQADLVLLAASLSSPAVS